MTLKKWFYCGVNKTQIMTQKRLAICNNVDLVIFAFLYFRKFVILGLFMRSRISELTFLMIGSAHNNYFREFVFLGKIKTSQILPDLQYTTFSRFNLTAVLEVYIRWPQIVICPALTINDGSKLKFLIL